MSAIEPRTDFVTEQTGTKVDLEIYYLREEKKMLDHGYSEVPTRHRGRITGEKAILDSNGDYIKTVSDGFTLLTHETLEEKLKAMFGSKLYEIRESKVHGLSKTPRRKYFHIQMDADTEIVVTNSIDTSLAVQVWPVVDGTMLVGERFTKLYKMHTENFKIDELMPAIEKVGEYTAKYKMMLKQLAGLPIKDNIWILDNIQKEFEVEKMPKKYGELHIQAAKMGMEGLRTMQDLYHKISRELWASKMEMKTKKRLYEVLNDYMLMAWELRPQEMVAAQAP